MKQILTTLTGPSGSGKSAVLDVMCKDFGFERLISLTTRDPRPGEVHGKDYYFVTLDTFHKEQSDGQILQSVSFNGQMYGTVAGELTRVLDSGKKPVVIVEPSGVRQFSCVGDVHGFEVLPVFIWAERDALIQRYFSRLVGETLTSEGAAFHAKRIQSLLMECAEWCKGTYNAQFENSSDKPERLTTIARDIRDLVDQSEKETD